MTYHHDEAKWKRWQAEWKQQDIEAGRYGEEYEQWEARKPEVPRRLALGCYEELQPLYEFLVTYAQESAKAGQVLKFDASRLEVYDKYMKVMHYHELLEYHFVTSQINIACQIVRRMLEGDMNFHLGMEMLYKYLKRWGFGSHLPKRAVSRAYRGEHFEALVDRYIERIDAYKAEGERIAAENLKKRGETNE